MVIRPLSYCREQDIERYAMWKGFPIIPCNLCGSQENLQRQVIKEMLQMWDKKHPGRIETIFNAIQNATPSHLLDRTLYDFVGFTDHDRFVLATDEESCQSTQGRVFGELDILTL